MKLAPRPLIRLVLSPEIKAVIDLDPDGLIACLNAHGRAALRHVESGRRSTYSSECRWHGERVLVRSVSKARTLTTTVTFS